MALWKHCDKCSRVLGEKDAGEEFELESIPDSVDLCANCCKRLIQWLGEKISPMS